MSQLNELAEMIVAAIDRVNRSIQKTQTYIDANTYSIVGNGMAVSSGVSGTLGFLGVLTELGLELDIEIAASGGAEGILDVLTRIPGIVEASGGAEGDLDILTKLVGDLAATGAVLDATLRDITRLLGGISESSGTGEAELDGQPKLIGICEGESVSIGEPFLR